MYLFGLFFYYYYLTCRMVQDFEFNLLSLLFSLCAFFISVLHSCSTLFELPFFVRTFFMLHSFYVALFPCCTLFISCYFHIAFFHVVLFSCCTFFMLHLFHVTVFHVALFPSCYFHAAFFVLYSFHVGFS